jgi:hypothetical protein
LYAEGRVETQSTNTLAVPGNALVREGDNVYAWRIHEGKLQKAALMLGERDARTGAFALKSGLVEGDRVVRFPNSTLKDGQLVKTDSGAKPTVVAEK